LFLLRRNLTLAECGHITPHIRDLLAKRSLMLGDATTVGRMVTSSPSATNSMGIPRKGLKSKPNQQGSLLRRCGSQKFLKLLILLTLLSEHLPVKIGILIVVVLGI
jgi:hypothetical protein